MNKVSELSKHCEICSSDDHFSVECRTYRDMQIDARYNVAKDKQLCTNCLLTTAHAAQDCSVKIGCGYIVDHNLRCAAKHHISLHRDNKSRNTYNGNRKFQSRNNARNNAARDNDLIQEHESKAVPQTIVEEQKQVMHHQQADSQPQGPSTMPPANVNSTSMHSSTNSK